MVVHDSVLLWSDFDLEAFDDFDEFHTIVQALYMVMYVVVFHFVF